MSSAKQTTQIPESFVVRVYRRSSRGPPRIAGTVEVVATGAELSFSGVRELEQVLGVRKSAVVRATQDMLNTRQGLGAHRQDRDGSESAPIDHPEDQQGAEEARSGRGE